MLNRAPITSGTRLLGSRFVASAASTRSLVHLLTKEKRPPSHKRAERGGDGSNSPFAMGHQKIWTTFFKFVIVKSAFALAQTVVCIL